MRVLCMLITETNRMSQRAKNTVLLYTRWYRKRKGHTYIEYINTQYLYLLSRLTRKASALGGALCGKKTSPRSIMKEGKGRGGGRDTLTLLPPSPSLPSLCAPALNCSTTCAHVRVRARTYVYVFVCGAPPTHGA